ncbi:hypothetical protein [Neptuniibacter sp. CAU 1671]|uniref:hypothetical protein n=1 Tax=Neptuniibacter sp. CAU 1671 TaxID=3032593 RepID=UPI0023DB626E|nr:hypothetical protein [Neptuniibacter sp. CAU 1671]MDF2183119.1 hypothetical protein [Neptuniibacter sp. CAU 1671]
MDVLPIHVFKHSFKPILNLLKENGIQYQMREIRAGEIIASAGVIEIILNATMWVSLASVIIAFIKAKNGREVMITTKDNKIIHAKGLDSKQLQAVLEQAKDIKAIDTGKERET